MFKNCCFHLFRYFVRNIDANTQYKRFVSAHIGKYNILKNNIAKFSVVFEETTTSGMFAYKFNLNNNNNNLFAFKIYKGVSKYAKIAHISSQIKN